MSIFITLFIFAVGLLLVVKGGDWFVDAASWFAKVAGISPFIIGATIVSVATTLPEIIVSVVATIEGKRDIAIGNAIGSVTANTGLIMALSFVFLSSIIHGERYKKQCILLTSCALVLWVGSADGYLHMWATFVLVGIFLAFMYLNIRNARRGLIKASAKRKPMDKSQVSKHVCLFIAGAGAIVVGSNFLVNQGAKLAVIIGVPERVIGVTMIALGTSLPELVTAITAIRKKEAQMSIGNIIGANIIDLSLILPICSMISGNRLFVSRQIITLDMPFCFLVILIAVLPMLFNRKVTKFQGMLCIVIYALFVAATFIL